MMDNGRSELAIYRGSRLARQALGACCAALLLSSCARPDEEPVAVTPTPAQTTSTLPTGSDYHSTVIRARGRTNTKLDDIQQIREEQVKEELDFSKTTH